jgi:3-hydroxyacyl-CoA dehydrogenase, NAD binding domain
MTIDTQSEPEFRNATVIGGGVIGISWTALFLAYGLQVTVSDPLPDAEDRVRAGLKEIAPTLEQLGLPVTALEEKSPALAFEADTATAVAAADVVQENAPERLDVKQQLWQAIERAAPAHTLFASSSSSLPASETAKGMQAPGRLIVGHPFNPPHLVPLVEVAPSKNTDPAVVELAVAFYTSVGKRPQVLGREIPGFVANRPRSSARPCTSSRRESSASRRSTTSSRPRSGCGGRSPARSAPSTWVGGRAAWPTFSSTSALRCNRSGRSSARRRSIRKPSTS